MDRVLIAEFNPMDSEVLKGKPAFLGECEWRVNGCKFVGTNYVEG